jgi:holin-like protein
MLKQIGIIFSILFVGNFLQMITGLPIPGTVIGMIILLVCLLTGTIKVEMVDDISKFLLAQLTFLFVPAGVGIMTSIDVIKDKWLSILLIIILSTVIVIAVTGLTVQALKKMKKVKKEAE